MNCEPTRPYPITIIFMLSYPLRMPVTLSSAKDLGSWPENQNTAILRCAQNDRRKKSLFNNLLRSSYITVLHRCAERLFLLLSATHSGHPEPVRPPFANGPERSRRDSG